ncbi:MAG: PEP-CTERM sorting domain-containing protein [Planctomycetota bacterium]|nr:PEP-CTERM sorting domain-containing protein [Planctomycetota bacterium]
MSKNVVRAAALFGCVSAATAMSASAVVITDTPAATEAGLLTGLVPLDLSSVVVSGLTTSNSLSVNFTAPLGAYSGTLTARVYGNQGTPGTGLNDVLVIYEFVGNGPDMIDEFEFGVDSGASLDFSDLLSATQGTIQDLSVGQGSPLVELTNGVATNTTQNFGFLAAGDGLGGPATTESFAWYIRSGGDVQVNLVDVVARDFGNVTVQSLALVDIPGQPDLNVPAPGALALLGAAGVMGLRRRR